MARLTLACFWLVFLVSEIWRFATELRGVAMPRGIQIAGTYALAAGFLSVIVWEVSWPKPANAMRWGRRLLRVAAVLAAIVVLFVAERALPVLASSVVSSVVGVLLGAALLGWTFLRPAPQRSA